jgi:prepilin-type N-terminal cleavage/methylation domain-containing protein
MNTNKGFTLIETLIAVSILVLAVTGAFAAAQNGISLATFSKDQIVAFYLAEEGIEGIRNIRDKNGLDGTFWLDNLAQDAGDPCYFGHICKIDSIEDELSECGTEEGSCPVLRQDPDAGFFGYNSEWNPTQFRREIELTLVNEHEVLIAVTVTWSKGLISRSFKAQEVIFNWQ